MSDLNALNLEAGQIVGGYTLISRLGGGAMGSVWKVHDGGGQVYAMKILRDSLVQEPAAAQRDGLGGSPYNYDGHGPDAFRDSPDQNPAATTARERLRREALALRKIKHPGVCSIVDMELDDALAFIVTELIDGKNLQEDVLANGRYIGDDLERLTTKLISAVQAVHAAGIVHRDIKPTNVMISATGPVLVDFGIAMGEGESHVTKTGLVMGTPGFIAPEVIEGSESDEQTDWWSTASVLAFAATGRPVFGTKPMMAVLERAAAGSASLSGLPQRTLKAFRAALHPDRAQRCKPDQLLAAISADAMMPNAWNSQLNEPGIGSTEVMRPFEAGGPAAPGITGSSAPQTTEPSARALWGDDAPRAQVPALTTAIQPENDTLAMSPSSAPAYPPTQALPPVAQPQPVSIPPYEAVVDARPDPPTDPSAPPLYPIDGRRNAYLRRGTLPICMAAVPLGLLSASLPMSAMVLSAIVLWLLLAVGFSAQSQLDREEKHPGAHRFTDAALRVATAPWHLAKALLAAFPRALAYTAIAISATIILSWVLGLPVHRYSARIGSWTVAVNVLAGRPWSLCGLVLAGCSVLSWLAVALGPYSPMLRLGAGAMRGTERRTALTEPSTAVAQDGSPRSSGSNRQGVRLRAAALFLPWLALTAATLIAVFNASAIDWTPLLPMLT